MCDPMLTHLRRNAFKLSFQYGYGISIQCFYDFLILSKVTFDVTGCFFNRQGCREPNNTLVFLLDETHPELPVHGELKGYP